MCCSGPGWPALDTLRGRLFLVWTPESFHDYLNLYPNLENALCFVSSVDGNSGDDGGTTVTDPAGVFIQTYDGLSWSSPVTAAEIAAFETRVSLALTAYSKKPIGQHQICGLPSLQQTSSRFGGLASSFAHQGTCGRCVQSLTSVALGCLRFSGSPVSPAAMQGAALTTVN